MVKKYFILFLFSGLLFYSCNKENQILVSGQIEDVSGDYIYLQELSSSGNKNIIMDSTKCKRDGRFKIKVKSDIPKFLELKLNNNIIFLIVFPGDNIKVFSNYESFSSHYRVIGSEESEKVRILNQQLNETILKIDSLNLLIKPENPDDVNTRINNEINETVIRHKQFLISHILKDINSLSNIFALYQRLNNDFYFLNTYKDIQHFKNVSDSLYKNYPNVNYVKYLKNNTTALISEYQRTKLLSGGTKIKNTVPDIILPDIKGDTVKLSSLAGKYVLLSFWNPNNENNISFNNQLINLYKQYKSKGFEIFQVAFDEDSDNWKGKIKFLEIPWVSVCDSRGVNSIYLGMYNISNLPTTFLLDPSQEKILGRDLSVKKLDIKLNYNLNAK